MANSLNIRNVTVELLRSGPSHNQLLSPLTLYLGICDEAEAGIVTLPFEHAAFLRRIAVMRYEADKTADKLPELRALGVEMAKVLGAIPRLPGSVSADSAAQDTLVHLRLVLSASELALLPFELAKMPIGPTAWTESWLALQSRVPVVITRRTRNVTTRDAPWMKNPRVLFISAETDPDAPNSVPFAEHRLALINAVRPFLQPEDRTPQLSHGGEREQFGRLLTIWRKPRFENVVAECASQRYTCIHVLAHGREDKTFGDTTYGLELHPRDGVIAGDRLASAFTALHDGRIHRPDVVSLATCDSGNNEAAVVTPGASIAHVLHQAGVPLVLASQFPLSKLGSVLVTRLFYSGLLWGDNPWVLLHRVRTNLHGTMGPGDHDWASLVVYEALNLDTYKLDQACFHQCYQAMLAAWLDDDGAEDELADVDLPFSANGSVVGRCKASMVIPRLPVASKFFGMRALALRADAHLQNAIDCLGTINRSLRRQNELGEFEDRVARSCRELEHAIDDHEAAALGFLVKDGQGMNAPYRSLVALLRLRSVLGRRLEPGTWETAYFWLNAMLAESPFQEEKVSAWACLAELWLLRTLHPEESVRRQAAEEALRAAGEMTRLDRAGSSMATRWLRVLLATYVRFWGDKRFEQALATFGEAERPSFRQGPANLVDTARSLRDILVRQGLREQGGTIPKLIQTELKQLARPTGRSRHKPPPALPLQANEPAGAGSGGHDRGDGQGRSAAAKSRALKGRLGGAVEVAPAKPPAAKAQAGSAFFRIEMLPARHGDALWIEYGRGQAAPARVLVDCGPLGAYKQHLRPRIEALPPAQRHFELFILSHIDDDHIGGAIQLLKDARDLGVTFGDIWFNGYKHLPGVLNAKQGEAFSALIVQNGLNWNTMLRDLKDDDADAVQREADELPELRLPGGMRLTVLSPTPVQLAALRRSWTKEIEAKGLKPGETATGQRFLGRVPVPPTVDTVPALAAEEFESDATAANGSSIAVLAEFDDMSVLLGADAHAPVLEQAVDLLIARRKPARGRLPLSAFKLPHHGSQNNLSTTLLKKLQCRDFLVSTSGERFNHPDSQAIARVVMQGGLHKLPARLWFNYRASEKLNGAWDDPAIKKKYGYDTAYPDGPDVGMPYSVPDVTPLKP